MVCCTRREEKVIFCDGEGTGCYRNGCVILILSVKHIFSFEERTLRLQGVVEQGAKFRERSLRQKLVLPGRKNLSLIYTKLLRFISSKPNIIELSTQSTPAINGGIRKKKSTFPSRPKFHFLKRIRYFLELVSAAHLTILIAAYFISSRIPVAMAPIHCWPGRPYYRKL